MLIPSPFRYVKLNQKSSRLVKTCFKSSRNDKMIFFSADIYLLKLNNRNTGTICELSSNLTIKALEQGHWRSSGVFIVNFEHVSYHFLVFLLLSLNM